MKPRRIIYYLHSTFTLALSSVSSLRRINIERYNAGRFVNNRRIPRSLARVPETGNQ